LNLNKGHGSHESQTFGPAAGSSSGGKQKFSIMSGFNKLRKANSSQGFITTDASMAPQKKTQVMNNERSMVNAASGGPMTFQNQGRIPDPRIPSNSVKRESFDGSLYPTPLRFTNQEDDEIIPGELNNSQFDRSEGVGGGIPLAGDSFNPPKPGRRAMFQDEASYSVENMMNLPSMGKKTPKRGILKKNISATSSTPESTRKFYNSSQPNVTQIPHSFNMNSSSPNISVSKNAYFNSRPPTISGRPYSRSPERSRQAGKISASPLSLGVGNGARAGRVVTQGSY